MSDTQAAIDRPVGLRMRPDLVLREQWFGGRRHVVVKDPLALTYAYLTEEEHFVLELLNGQISVAQIINRFGRRYAPQQLSWTVLQSFLTQLHRSGLVLGLAPGQGEQLHKRREAKRQGLLGLAEKLLSIRWRGIDAEWLLTKLDPIGRLLFSKIGLALWIMLVGWAAGLAILHWPEIVRRMPDAAAWLAGGNLWWLMLATIVVKTLHELGHALAARRMGCQAREIGFQLFFLLPCLYTNVSDVWLVPGKWRRIAVSAAGIYVELVLAAVATLIWWQAEPGVISSLCLNVMLVASLGTLVLNGNPLMRYDGYYILSDLVEVPNLEQRSQSQLLGWLIWCATGAGGSFADGLKGHQSPLLAAYAALALIYRAGVLLAVYFGSRALLTPLRLEPLSDVLLASALVGMLLPLAMTAGQFLTQAHRRNELRPTRLAILAAVVLAAVAVVFLVPLPQRIMAPAVVEARDASRIYVTVSGTLQTALPAGSRVEKGQVLIRLDNPELRRDLVRLESELKREELHLLELETTRGDDPAATAAIPSAQQTVADLKARIDQVREMMGRLDLASPRGGVVLPPPRVQRPADSRDLRRWTGTPLDPANRGSFLENGTLACLVGNPGEIDAVAIVEQSDVPLVQQGAMARVAIAQWPKGSLRGTVEEIAAVKTEQAPLHLAATRAVAQRSGQSGVNSLQTTYEVRVRLENPPADLLPGATGRVKIAGRPETIASRAMRCLGQTFRFRSSLKE
jgi:putative peptide zinc metalloprotease protein